MKKKIILIFICLFCIGCEAKYELHINKDLSVTENMIGLENDTFYDNYYNSTKERVISFMTETKDEHLNEVGYTKEIVTENDLTGAKVSKKFSTLEEYFEKSQAYTQFYEEWKHTVKNGIVTISLKNQLLRNEDSIERYVIDNCYVSITLPFKVKKSNADNVDNKTNTYSWKLNDHEAKDIYIKFDINKEASYKQVNYIPYIIVSCVFICVFIIVYVFYKKYKLNNIV